MNAMVEDAKEPERPRAEPEIIPPDHGDNEWQSRWSPYGYTRTRGPQRIFVTRVGPLGIALFMLAIAVIAAIGLLVILGALLIWIPAVILAVIIAAIAGVFRRR
jgi:hypothetical protein